MPPSPDIVVVGAGPAGTLFALECAKAGASVELWSPTLPAPWPNNYGLWSRDLQGDEDWTDAASHRYDHPQIHFMDHPSFALPDTYIALENTRLRQNLLARFFAHHGQVREKRATRLVHTPTHMELTDEDGERTKATLVIDATGHTPALVTRPSSPLTAHQVAWGMLARVSPHGAPVTEATLMDFTLAHDTPHTRAHPSFLYMFPRQDGLVFFQETSLAARPPMALAILKQRLFARLGRQGIVIDEILEEERCVIPMGDALPHDTPGLVGWGGAGSMVHPATGYQLGRARRWAPEVAGAAVAGLGGGPLAAARCMRQALWTPQRQRNRALYVYGLQAMLGFGAAEQSAFFAAFFATPEALWRGYYEGELDTGGMSRAMWHVFKEVPDHAVRWGLMKGAFQKHGRLLGEGLWGGRRGGGRP